MRAAGVDMHAVRECDIHSYVQQTQAAEALLLFQSQGVQQSFESTLISYKQILQLHADPRQLLTYKQVCQQLHYTRLQVISFLF